MKLKRALKFLYFSVLFCVIAIPFLIGWAIATIGEEFEGRKIRKKYVDYR
jgi:hypothetical protein